MAGGGEQAKLSPAGVPAAVLRAGDSVSVRLVKSQRPELRYPAVVLADDGTHVVVRAPWSGGPARDVGYVRYEPGDMWTEHFWRDRWYSVKEIRDDASVLKGWYCDVARPAEVRAETITVEDLDLDLWVSADLRTVLRLDEDEFLASNLTERDPEAAEQAWRALDELAEHAHDGFRALLDPAPDGVTPEPAPGSDATPAGTSG